MSFFILKRGCVSPSFGSLAAVTTERDVYNSRQNPNFTKVFKISNIKKNVC